MKKAIFFGSFVLIFVSMVLVSYAAMTKGPLSRSDLPALKGKWVGTRTVGTATVLNTDLEIHNDTLPVEGKFIFYDVLRAGRRGTETINFKAKINEKGNLYVKGGNVEVELSLYKEDAKIKLEGDYFWAGAKGTMSFKKK